MEPSDERFMTMALGLARRARFTAPNPKVGAVLVRDGAVVAEGFHRGPGHPHAEVDAVNGIDAKGATLYVTLEPCSFQGRTPPCAPALVDAGIGRVVAAMQDPDERVAGRGLRFLESNGVEVSVGILEDEARELNAAYVHQRLTGTPLMTCKLALTLDGRMAAPDGSARWITGPAARRRVHERRLEVDAVVVGAGTVVADDPALTARVRDASRQPARVVVDSSGRIPPDAAIFAPGGDVVVATTDRSSHDRQTQWKEAGAEVVVLPAVAAGIDLAALVRSLAGRGWIEILCEGGAALATSLLAADLVDRLELHYGPVVVGSGGPSIGDVGASSLGDARRWSPVEHGRLDDDLYVVLRKRDT